MRGDVFILTVYLPVVDPGVVTLVVGEAVLGLVSPVETDVSVNRTSSVRTPFKDRPLNPPSLKTPQDLHKICLHLVSGSHPDADTVVFTSEDGYTFIYFK